MLKPQLIVSPALVENIVQQMGLQMLLVIAMLGISVKLALLSIIQLQTLIMDHVLLDNIALKAQHKVFLVLQEHTKQHH